MQIPLQITYIRMKRPDSLDAKIREYADQLDERFGRIMSCRVVVEAPRKHKNKGMLYHARVDVKTPGGEIVANRETPLNHAHEDVYVAVRDAFKAVRRRLEEYARKRRHKVKTHTVCPHGRISNMFLDRDYGIIETSDGRDVYFHRNSVINAGFEDLRLGDEVRFCEESGNSGIQASSVRLIGKHHIVG